MKYAVMVGVAPIVLAFILGFFGVTVGIGWPGYIAWLALSIAVGAAVVAMNKANG